MYNKMLKEMAKILRHKVYFWLRNYIAGSQFWKIKEA